MRAQRGGKLLHQADILGVVKALSLADQAGTGHQFLDPGVALLGEVHLLGLLFRRVVAGSIRLRLWFEPGDELVDLVIDLGALLGGARDDQRRPRLVDQDGVHLVDDRVGQVALDPVLETERQVVAQVVESELVVRAVRDVGRVGRTLRLGIEAASYHPDREAERLVDGPHPCGVAAREVLVDRDDVDAFAGERIQIGGQRRDERLSLTRPHLGDLAVVQHHPAEQLDVEVPQAETPPCRFPDAGESFHEQVVELHPVLESPAEFHRLGLQLVVAQRPDLPFQAIDPGGLPSVLLQEALVTASKNSCED